MSKYTTEVRFICEERAGLSESVGEMSVDEVISASYDKIFDPDIPFFDNDYRFPLEQKILKHYYTREIGYETFGLWKFHLNNRLREIMPYYNQLYKSELIEFEPMQDTDYYTNHSGTFNGQTNDDGSSTSNTTTSESGSSTDDQTNKITSRYSDTPQGAISDLENNTYLTNATINDETRDDDASYQSSGTNNNRSTAVNDRTISNTDTYLDHIFGKRGTGTYSEYLQKYRDTFLNIDMMVIKDLSDLFLNLW